MSTTYKKYRTGNDEPILVDAAIRDGAGKNIENNYAKQTGSYDTMSVGKATSAVSIEPLSNSGVVQTSPFTIEATGTDDNRTSTVVGTSAKIEALKGNSVIWNQLAGSNSHYTQSGFEMTLTNGVFSISGTGTVANLTYSFQATPVGHKILQMARIIKNDDDVSFSLWSLNDNEGKDTHTMHSVGDFYANIYTSKYYHSNFGLHFSSSVTVTDLQVIYMVFDLTRIYGAGNEPKDVYDIETGELVISAINQFIRDFPLRHYAYNSGKLIDGESTELISTECNVFDGELAIGEWKGDPGETIYTSSYAECFRAQSPISVVGGQTYVLDWDFEKYPNLQAFLFETDENGVVLYSRRYTSTGERLLLTLKYDTTRVYIYWWWRGHTFTNPPIDLSAMFRLYWDEELEYSEYNNHEYTLPTLSEPLRSTQKRFNVSNDEITVRDTLTPDGTLTRRVGSITVAELNWSYDNGHFHTEDLVNVIKKPASASVEANLISSLYNITKASEYESIDRAICVTTTGAIYLNDSEYTTVSAFVTNRGAKKIYYELNEPEVETTEVFAETIITNDYGMLEFVQDGAVKVKCGIDIFYPVNYVGLVDDLYLRTEGEASKVIIDSQLQATVGNIEEGNIVAGKSLISEQLENVSDDSGSHQEKPFVFQATGTDSNITSTPTSPIAHHILINGNSVVWNQLAKIGSHEESTTDFGITYSLDQETGVATFSGTNTSESRQNISLIYSSTAVKTSPTHKFLVKWNLKGTQPSYSEVHTNLFGTASDLTDKIYDGNQSGSVTTYAQIAIKAGATVNFSIQPQIFDLTLMFGGLEAPDTNKYNVQPYIPSSVLEFNRLFPLPYYVFNTGELMSCDSIQLVDTGYNQFTGLNEFIRVIPGNWYRLVYSPDFKELANIASGAIQEYDGALNLIKTTYASGLVELYSNDYENVPGDVYTSNDGLKGLELSESTQFVKIIDVTEPNIVFNIAWDGSRSDYEDHIDYTYNLPVLETKINSAKFAHDSITPDGTLTRRIEKVDILTLINGQYRLSDTAAGGKCLIFDVGYGYIKDDKTPKLGQNAMTVGSIVSNRYSSISNNTAYNQSTYSRTLDNTIDVGMTGTIKILSHDLDNLSTKADLIAYYTANPTYIQYELETPVEESVSTFASSIRVDDFGTMKFVPSDSESASTPIIPQGNEFFYPADYVLFIDDIYSAAEGDAANIAFKSDILPELTTGDIKTKTIVLTGAEGENWSTSGTYPNVKRFNLSGTFFAYRDSDHGRGIGEATSEGLTINWIQDSTFSGISSLSMCFNGTSPVPTASQLILLIPNSEGVSTVAELRTWLGTHNITVEYQSSGKYIIKAIIVDGVVTVGWELE